MTKLIRSDPHTMSTSESKFRLRKATRDDIPAVVRVTIEAFTPSAISRLAWPDPESRYESLERELQGIWSNRIFWPVVAYDTTDNDNVVGVALWGIFEAQPNDSTFGKRVMAERDKDDVRRLRFKMAGFMRERPVDGGGNDIADQVRDGLIKGHNEWIGMKECICRSYDLTSNAKLCGWLYQSPTDGL